MDNNKYSHPIISLIIPIYNSQLYISRCIDSVLSQTFQEWELLLIDDGSLDKSGQICDNYAGIDARIKVFHNENKGSLYSRFFGVENAQGDYICFMDSDDSMPADAFEILYNCALEYKTDIVIGSYSRILVTGKTDYCGFSFKQTDGKELLLNLVSGNWKIYGPWAKLFKKELFVFNCSHISKEIYYGEDLLMNIGLSVHANSVVFISSLVYNYYQINTSITHKFKYSIKYTLRYLQELKKILLENNVVNYEELLLHYKMSNMYNIILRGEDSDLKNHKEYVQNILNESQKIKKQKKEKVVILLLKWPLLRKIFRCIMK